MQDKSATLTPKVKAIVLHQQTEEPGSGKYCAAKQDGTYLCRLCGISLFSSGNKFESGTGWPSFDASNSSNVSQKPDPDGLRTEIVCQRCQAHLGHVFKGENMTSKNERYCVNSLALDLVKHPSIEDSEEVIFAGGCFWGVESLLASQTGVLKTECGYTGGQTPDPSYKTVCLGTTGHIEAVRVLYDPKATSFETLARYFFEIHDPTQENRQGPDVGEQYQSAIFTLSNEQKQVSHKLMKQLGDKNYNVKTRVLSPHVFWPAEEEHQSYYKKTGKTPYCHVHVKRFN